MKYVKFYSNRLKQFVKQINKTTARKLYDNGETIYINSCNMSFDNISQSAMEICKNDAYYCKFETKVNSFICYNCDNYRGKYPVFFVIANN